MFTSTFSFAPPSRLSTSSRTSSGLQGELRVRLTLANLSIMLMTILLLSISTTAFASGLGGYTGTSNRFTSDPLSSGTGGITLFHKTSTNSYSQNPASQAFFGQSSFNAGLVQLSLDRFIYTVNAGVPYLPRPVCPSVYWPPELKILRLETPVAMQPGTLAIRR